jgi:hypothetical protein
MHCVNRGRKIMPAMPDKSPGRVAVGLDNREASCSAGLDTSEGYLGGGITRAEVMEYLSQTYGPVFVTDLVKHLP